MRASLRQADFRWVGQEPAFTKMAPVIQRPGRPDAGTQTGYPNGACANPGVCTIFIP